MKGMTLREGTKEDSRFIADLIYTTEDDPQHVWGEGSREEILDRITWLVESEGSRYSYNNVKVAEVDNKVCGAIILLDGSEIQKLDLRTSFKLLKIIKGTRLRVKFFIDIILGIGFDECGKNELYIANLATSKEFQGKGIGRSLLKLAEKTAKKEGYKCCSLLAKDESLKGFYEKLDFCFEKEEVLFSHILYKMIKVV